MTTWDIFVQLLKRDTPDSDERVLARLWCPEVKEIIGWSGADICVQDGAIFGRSGPRQVGSLAP